MSDAARPHTPRTTTFSWSKPSLRVATLSVTPEGLALLGILVVSLLFEVVSLGQEGYANTYYAAAVKSMLTSWHNFFFLSLDPSGFLAVDKPPLGLWIQAASAKVFGFSGASILLPQILTTVGSVALLYYLLRHPYGPAVALLGAAALAVTPIAVIDGRNNSPDSLLTLTLMMAGWAVIRAVQTQKTRWLMISAVLVGLGFNIKELEAYLVVPAIAAAFWVGMHRRWWSRLWSLIVAGLVMLIVSASWMVAVDLVPRGQRPYITDSGTNSELSLALGYNGMGRFLSAIASTRPTIPLLNVKLDLSIVPGISTKIYQPGPFRLFRPVIAEQVGWLLVPAGIGLGFAFWRLWKTSLSDDQRVGYALWAGWLLVGGGFFSVARFYHLYYLVILAPAVSALAGMGLVGMWTEFRAALSKAEGARAWKGLLLPVGLVGTAAAQAFVLLSLFQQGGWPVWIWIPIMTVDVLVTLCLLVIRYNRHGRKAAMSKRVNAAAFGLTVAAALALFTAPTTWAAVSVAQGNGGAWIPQAGSSSFLASSAAETPAIIEGPGGGAGGAMTYAGAQVPKLDPRLIRYLEEHKDNARYLVGTTTSAFATLFLLQTNDSVMMLGGYQGWDRILTLAYLGALIDNQVIRFFMLPVYYGRDGHVVEGSFTSGPGIEDYRYPKSDVRLSRVNNDLARWLSRTCKRVPPQRYDSETVHGVPLTLGGGRHAYAEPGELFDCHFVPPETG